MITDMHTHLLNAPEAESELLAAARRAGIGRLIVSDLADWSDFPDAAAVRAGNDRARAAAERHPGVLFWLVYVNPQLPDAEAELERGKRGGACGVKLWISLRDAGGGVGRTVEILRRAAELDLGVLIHTFSRTDALRPGEADAALLLELARQVPACRIVAAHLGGNWRATLDLLSDAPGNVWWDLSGGYPEAGMLEGALARLAPERILWGSDAPGRSFDSQLSKVREASVDPAVLPLLLNGNAERLFGLPAAGTLPDLPCPAMDGAMAWEEAEEHFAFCGRRAEPAEREVTPAELAGELAAAGVVRAAVADLSTVGCCGLTAANREFRRRCAPFSELLPLATVNPRMTGVRSVIAAAARDGFAGVWLSPFRHDWRVDDPAYSGVFRQLAESGMAVYLNCALGDRRFRPAGTAWRETTAAELSALAERFGQLPLVVQGADLAPADFAALAAKSVWRFEFSRLTDHEGKLRRVLAVLPPGRLLAGSEFPLRALRQTRRAARCGMAD